MADDKIEVFICYAHKDESLMRDIERQLNVLVKQELITLWHDRMIVAGIDWKQEVHKHLNAARIILLLVSADFIFSEYSNIEVKRAMERYNAGEAQVIPVILKPVMWKVSPFGKLSPLPKNGKPITSSAWHNRDEALLEVAEGVQQAVEELRRPVVPLASQGSSGAVHNSSNKEQQPMPQDATSEEFDVFLCHNSQDKPRIKEIARQLQAQGLKPWLDEWQLRPGLPWQRALERQIEQIKSAAVFVGKNGQGPWQTMELEAFIREFVDRECPVIPVLLADAPEKPRLPPFLRGMTWVDFRKPETEPLERLIWGITGKNPNDMPSDGAETKSGDSGAPVASPSPTSPSRPVTLSVEKRFELVNKLLACDYMSDRDRRKTVLRLLNDQFPGIADTIDNRSDNRSAVMEIVLRCSNYPGSLQSLVDIVSGFEGEEATCIKQLRAFMASNPL